MVKPGGAASRGLDAPGQCDNAPAENTPAGVLPSETTRWSQCPTHGWHTHEGAGVGREILAANSRVGFFSLESPVQLAQGPQSSPCRMQPTLGRHPQLSVALK
jgi:hypothetical protein